MPVKESTPPSYSLSVSYVRSASGGKSLLAKGKTQRVKGYNAFFDEEGVMDQETFEKWVGELVEEAMEGKQSWFWDPCCGFYVMVCSFLAFDRTTLAQIFFEARVLQYHTALILPQATTPVVQPILSVGLCTQPSMIFIVSLVYDGMMRIKRGSTNSLL